MVRSARSCLLGLFAGVGVVAIGCGGASTRDAFDTNLPADGGSAPSTGVGQQPSAGFGGSGDAGPSADGDGCSEEAKLVYVLSLEGDLYSFSPAAKKFTKIGPLNCQSGNKKFIPISMAVDRNAVAWVNMREDSSASDPFGGDPLSDSTDDIMFKVDTKTGACTATNIKGTMGGMGFSTDDGTKDKETLYVVGTAPDGFNPGLMKVDFAAEKLVPITALKEPVDMELTGTGDGRLYGFLMSRPLAVAQVDKTTSAFSKRVSLTQVETPRPPMFAFSFWGGDFYFYTATNDSSARTTTVSRYRPSDGSVDTAYMTSIGFHIVGAGVSTCAPTTGPH